MFRFVSSQSRVLSRVATTLRFHSMSPYLATTPRFNIITDAVGKFAAKRAESSKGRKRKICTFIHVNNVCIISRKAI
jgi:hypothetical protein